MPKSKEEAEEIKITTGRKIFFALVIIIILFSILEGTLRCIDALRPKGAMPTLSGFMEPDEVYGWKNIKGFKGDGISINSLGYRNKEFAPGKAKDIYRIICLGDSVIFGSGVKGEENTISGQLEKILEKNRKGRGNRFEVINGGVMGYPSFNVLLKLQKEVLAFEPDMIVICVGWNDLFLIDPELSKEKTESKSGASGVRKVLFQFETFKTLRNLIYGRKGNFNENTEIPASYETFDPVRYREFLSSIAQTARAHHIICVLCTMPTMINDTLTEADYSKIKFPFFTKEIKALRLLHRKYNESIRKVAAEQKVLLCDLDRDIVKKEFFCDQAHPTADGDRIAAEKLSYVIEKSLRN